MRYLLILILITGCKSFTSKEKAPDVIINNSIEKLAEVSKEIDKNADAILENSKGVQPVANRKAIQIHAKQIKDGVKKVDNSVKPALSEAVKGTKAIEKERDKLQKEKDSGFQNMLRWVVLICLAGIGICVAVGLKVNSLADEAAYIGAGLFVTAICCYISLWILSHIWIIAIIFLVLVGAIGFKFLHKNRKKLSSLVEQSDKND